MFVRLKQFCRFLWILRLRGSRGANLSKPLDRFTLSPGTHKPPTPPKSDFKKKMVYIAELINRNSDFTFETIIDNNVPNRCFLGAS